MRIANDVGLPVRIHGIRPELVLGLKIVEDVFHKAGEEVVLTSVIDGKHSRGSLHYTGSAADIRTRDIPPEIQIKLVDMCKENLGPDFDIIKEYHHIHLEFQPKASY